uniref:phosphoglycerate mutase (2,3-diphosphoglycerate-dependent) n=1 Tax=Attheya septentrionalis TaxID=420275 RepID=A0A7S2UE49_9STRA
METSPRNASFSSPNETKNSSDATDKTERVRGEEDWEKCLKMPASESLGDTGQRVDILWRQAIRPRLGRGETVLVVAHANTIRSLLYSIKDGNLSRTMAKDIKIPSAVPLLYQFDAQCNVLPPSSSAAADPTLGHVLNGTWLDTNDMQKLSFCSSVGIKSLEHEIA